METSKTSKVAGKPLKTKRQADFESENITEKSLTDTYHSDQESQEKAERYKRRLASVSNKFDSISNRVADSNFFYKSYLIREFKNIWPAKAHFWYVDKYYPHAKGGPLLIDEPQKDSELPDLKLKAEEFKKMGKRYLILTPQTTVLEAAEMLGIDPDELDTGEFKKDSNDFEVKRVD